MRTYPDCMPCLVRQGLNAMRLCEVGDERIFSAMKHIFRCAMEFDPSQSPPEMAMEVHRIVRRECGAADPYLAMKKQAIAEVRQYESRIREKILASANPFRTAARFALVGNVLDFAVFDWNPKQLAGQLESALNKPVDESALDRFDAAVRKADRILYLGDNAGESVFDKLLIEQFGAKTVLYGVRGAPTINDVTESDAVASGLTEVAALLGNGSDAPGTLLDRVSETFRKEFDSADLIVAKGQGNYESLSESKRPVFFLTQVKCPVIARDLKAEIGDWVVAESKGKTV